MTQKKTIPKKAPKRVQHVEHLSAKNVPGHRPKKKKKAMKEVQKIGGQKALNALNALSVRHLRNVLGRRPKKKKKVTKEIKKREEATKISCPIPHEKLRHRSERRRLKGRFSFRSVDFFTNILLIEIMIANQNSEKNKKTGSGRRSRR